MRRRVVVRSNRSLDLRRLPCQPRACQRGYPFALREQVLGVELAYGQVAAPWFDRPLDPFRTSMPISFLSSCRVLRDAQIIVIIAPPPAVAYPFILDVEGYPGQIINFFIVIGLFWLRYHKPNAPRPFKGLSYLLSVLVWIVLTIVATVWLPVAVFFLAASVFRTSLTSIFPLAFPCPTLLWQCSSRPSSSPQTKSATPLPCLTTCTSSSPLQRSLRILHPVHQVLPCGHRDHGRRRPLLGALAHRAEVVRVRLRAAQGEAQRRHRRHCGTSGVPHLPWNSI